MQNSVYVERLNTEKRRMFTSPVAIFSFAGFPNLSCLNFHLRSKTHKELWHFFCGESHVCKDDITNDKDVYFIINFILSFSLSLPNRRLISNVIKKTCILDLWITEIILYS